MNILLELDCSDADAHLISSCIWAGQSGEHQGVALRPQHGGGELGVLIESVNMSLIHPLPRDMQNAYQSFPRQRRLRISLTL